MLKQFEIKTTLQFLIFFFSFGAFAQITLEYTYDDNAVARVKLEYSGEKYYALKKGTNELIFYNADHTIWKTIVLPAPIPNPFVPIKVFYVSESKINPDANLEIIFGYFNDSTTSYESKVISENGTVLLTMPNTYEVHINELPGLPHKLITENVPSNVDSKVYSVPELTLENNYSEGNIRRIKLENSGEKYYLLDKVNNNAKVYSSNHSLWKTVNLPKPINTIYTNIDLVSETQLNPDALLEIGYAYSETVTNTTQYEAKIVNENNVVLLTVPNSNRLQISSLEGLQDKLIAQNLINYVNSTTVYKVPSLTLENAYVGQISRVILENSGEKYYTSYNPSNNQVKIYNSNHTLWKTIVLTTDNTFNSNNITTVSSISESKINPDALIELVYSYNTGLLAFCCETSSRVINEQGTILLDAQYVRNLQLNEIKGLANKLTGYQGSGSTNISSPTLVFSIGNLSTSDFDINTKIVITPNPAKSFVNINSFSAPIIEATVYNMNGVLVKKEIDQNITKIDINQLPTGIYIVNLTDFNNQKSTHKITISH